MERNPYFKKKLRIVVLMVVSQLLLSTFVGYWLVTQYKNEKHTLNRQLRTHYYDVRSEMFDRVLYESIITPIIENQDKSNYSNVHFKDIELNEQKKIVLVQSIVDLLNENEKSLDKIFDYYTSVYPRTEPDDITQNILMTIQNYIFQAGIRLPYQFMEDEKDLVFIKIDEELFKKLYLLRLEYNDIQIEAQWFDKSQQLIPDEKTLSVNRYLPDNETIEVEVLFSKYRLHLLKVIFVQICFGIILLSMTAFALIFTYQSYLRQIRLSVLRTDFINNITHELKIPVATAKAALEALRSFGMQANPEIMAEYLDMVANEMNRLDGLTSRVLEHSKLEKQEKHLKKESTNLGNLIQQCLNNINPLLTDKNIQLKYNRPDEEITLNLDALYIEGVIKNLLDNSIKYGGNNTEINIDLDLMQHQAVVAISDNGPGIPEGYINKVFDKFFRVPKGDQHNVKGFGLGLSFVALVIKQHNGTITAENLKEGGCRFTIKLPLEN